MRRIITGKTASGKTADAIGRYNRMLSDSSLMLQMAVAAVFELLDELGEILGLG